MACQWLVELLHLSALEEVTLVVLIDQPRQAWSALQPVLAAQIGNVSIVAEVARDEQSIVDQGDRGNLQAMAPIRMRCWRRLANWSAARSSKGTISHQPERQRAAEGGHRPRSADTRLASGG